MKQWIIARKLLPFNPATDAADSRYFRRLRKEGVEVVGVGWGCLQWSVAPAGPRIQETSPGTVELQCSCLRDVLKCYNKAVVSSVQFWLSEKQKVHQWRNIFIYLLLCFQPLGFFICCNWVKCAGFVHKYAFERCVSTLPLPVLLCLRKFVTALQSCCSWQLLPSRGGIPVWDNWGKAPELNVQSRNPEWDP